MDNEDSNTLEKIASKAKIRYDNMDVLFGNMVEGTNVYVPIDLTSVLMDFTAFKEALIDVKDFEKHAAISVLNIFAHYKHFFQLKGANHVIIIGFVKDNYNYDRSKDILNQVVDYCNFFPNVYMVPEILMNNRMYVHVVGAIMCHMKSISPSTHQSSIFVVSNSSINRQLMCLFPTRCAYTLMKTYSGNPQIIEKTQYMRDIMINPQFYDGSPYKAQLECMNVLLGRYFNTFKALIKKLRRNDDSKMQYLHKKSAEKANVLSTFMNSAFDHDSPKSASVQAVMYLASSGEFMDKNTYDSVVYFEKIYDFRFQNLGELNQLIIPLLEGWKKKIKDYVIARECETYKTLIAHPLFTNWLA